MRSREASYVYSLKKLLRVKRLYLEAKEAREAIEAGEAKEAEEA